ncbi:ABC transporter permease [Microbacterium sp. Leaf320]|uniref:ABC transporter permease n=1 Tax=Microbacterium sp. Leaf320 TaxID=1736334 RepID=UPI000A55187F|nr:ABC transporter permease [Microbacterium sp. Leaf320]
MKNSDLLRMAVYNSFRSKLRTSLTMLSLFVGAFTLTLTTALGAGVNDYVERQVATLSSGNILLVSVATDTSAGDGPAQWDPDGRTTAAAGAPLAGRTLLNAADIDDMKTMDGVTRVTPVTQVSVDWVERASADHGDRFEVTINPTSSVGQSDLLAGAQLDQATAENEIVVPEEYMDALGFANPAAAIGETVTLGYVDAERAQHTVDAVVVGVARESLFAAGAGANPALTETIATAQAPGGQVDG